MKICPGCPDKGLQPLDAFYAQVKTKDGRQGRCKECTKKYVRSNYANKRAEKSDYERERNQRPERKAAAQVAAQKHRQLNPEKYKARTAVNNALRDGRLVRRPCPCGALKVQAHHADYSKPLDVEWLCFKCHREHGHGQQVTHDDEAIAAE